MTKKDPFATTTNGYMCRTRLQHFTLSFFKPANVWGLVSEFDGEKIRPFWQIFGIYSGRTRARGYHFTSIEMRTHI